MEKKESKYTTLMVKKSLKKDMEDVIGSLGMKMTYSDLIKYLLDKHTNN